MPSTSNLFPINAYIFQVPNFWNNILFDDKIFLTHSIWTVLPYTLVRPSKRWCHGSGNYSLASHRGDTGQSMWGFVADKVALGQVFLWLLGISFVNIIPLKLSMFIYISHGRWTRDLLVATVQRHSLIPSTQTPSNIQNITVHKIQIHVLTTTLQNAPRSRNIQNQLSRNADT
jgi:hypothetical protein